MGALPVILYNNILASGVTATSTAADYSVNNIYDLRPYTYWKATTTATQYITMDAGSATSVDCLGIATGHNLGTAGATVSVESSTTGAWAGEEIVRLSGFTTSTNLTILKPFTTASVRYWRIKITGSSTAVKLGVVMLGARITFPSQVKIPFTPHSIGVETEDSISKAGHLLGSVIRYYPVIIKVSWSYIAESFVTGTFKTFFDNHGNLRKPFFWALDTTTYPSDCFFVRLDDKYKYEYPITKIGTANKLDLDMEGVI